MHPSAQWVVQPTEQRDKQTDKREWCKPGRFSWRDSVEKYWLFLSQSQMWIVSLHRFLHHGYFFSVKSNFSFFYFCASGIHWTIMCFVLGWVKKCLKLCQRAVTQLSVCVRVCERYRENGPQSPAVLLNCELCDFCKDVKIIFLFMYNLRHMDFTMSP